MSNILPIFKDSHVDFLSKLADQAIKAKGWIEMVDGPAALITLKVVNAAASAKIPDSYKEKFHSIMDEVIEKDYQGAAEILSDFINEKVDIPLLDESTEAYLFKGVMTYLVSLINLAA
jgi:hypothetical protein